MADTPRIDLTELEERWAQIREAMGAVLARIDPTGMTRPPRSPEERAWLEQHGGGPFVEGPSVAEMVRAYYERRYGGPPT